jgi:hypothetical protein
VPGIVRPGAAVREQRQDGFGSDLVPATERADPQERPGAGLLQGPAALSFEDVVVAAQRPEVGGHGFTAVPVLDRMVLIATSRATAAADTHTGTVTDLGVAAQRSAGQPVVPVGVEIAPPAVGVLAGDVGQHTRPLRQCRFGDPVAPGELGQERGGNVQLDDPAGRPGGGGAGGTSAGDAIEHEPAVGLGDSPSPLGAALVRDDGAGVAGGNRAEAGDLAGVLVAAEQRGERHPDLYADALVVVRGETAALVSCVCSRLVALGITAYSEWAVIAGSVREEMSDDVLSVNPARMSTRIWSRVDGCPARRAPWASRSIRSTAAWA